MFYAEHKSEPFFEDLIDYITSGPVIGMVLARKDGIAHWRRVLGPTKVSEASKKVPNSIRAIFGDPKSDKRNACHGSDSPSSAEREIEIIFPHIFQEESHRPGTAESAMVNGHTVPIRSPRTVFEVSTLIPYMLHMYCIITNIKIFHVDQPKCILLKISNFCF